MSSEEEGRVLGVAEERMGMDLEDNMGRERDRVEVPEFGVGRTGVLDRGSNSTPREGGCNVSGGLRLPIPRSEPLNQPSRNTPPPSSYIRILAWILANTWILGKTR